ncbi:MULTISPECIES: MazG nucleotide pyrophosphohydrolase domain-containing protein [Staphylococcus]|uniref:MazG nucleotide pyrophosphohydrolase domain-containing protein n=1 Tax=Staphylococcus TaxID=1279 RepID=UPI0008A3B823|nr:MULTISPECIES: MazG nucleotide pyrophosphohydrolase domain-containing protein [Staphylococcus]MDT3983771.1 MazG nucleotide pyrophosphohydrolase domain-containing protein [Staphylococcus ureilyticus]MDK7754021.1 MazG nucleotide pyrophosphohydrolase domain-containing protein [Staphylococcus sp. UMB10092B]OFQ91521.1 nucleotide pyrophosphohydrolase [Staphylococcus sp. HMSC065A08]OHO41661.1 nucleotide pyrophosphohydrolase [Staphylococcus sp. HMSC034G07]OIS27998.1 nucleotide pyrophosphohydrolase [
MTNKITIVGLGNYGIEDLPLGIYKFLKKQTLVYTRTFDHPVIQDLTSEGIDMESFDQEYKRHDAFQNVYEAIVTKLIDAARDNDIVYTVPGHPRVAETTTVYLEQYAQQHSDIEIEILGGKSFIDDIFEAVKVDPNDGFTMLDATDLQKEKLNMRTHTLITQVYSAMVAGDLKVTLMESYSDDQLVYIVDGASNNHANVIKTPLYEIDHYDDVFNNITSVFIPKVETEEAYFGDFDYAVGIINHLVDDEKGCPWDKVQTHHTLKRYLLEETFELFEAIDNEDDWHMIEELGDILLQVLLHASIGKKEGYMDINEVIQSLSEKMIRRHPHVFGDTKAETEEDLKNIWSDAKSKEGKEQRVKFEKVFADHFLALYDKTKNKSLDENALKRILEQGGK